MPIDSRPPDPDPTQPAEPLPTNPTEPPPASPPDAGPDDDAASLFRHRKVIRRTLLAGGVPLHHLDDIEADCLLAAVTAIRRGAYRPDPATHPRHALASWVRGIAWRRAAHHVALAHLRRELLAGDPWELARAEGADVAVDPDNRLLARAGLRALDLLDDEQLTLLIAVANGASTHELAALSGASCWSTAVRIRAARRELERLTLYIAPPPDPP